jgi:hypothetical protein
MYLKNQNAAAKIAKKVTFLTNIVVKGRVVSTLVPSLLLKNSRILMAS